jgi:hypothetical protein
LAKIRSVSDFIDRFLRGLQIGTVDPTIELNRIDFSAQSYETFHIVCATLTGWRVHARLLEVTNPAAVERIDGEGNCNRRENEVKKRHCYPRQISPRGRRNGWPRGDILETRGGEIGKLL